MTSEVESYLQRAAAESILLGCIRRDEVWQGGAAPSSFEGELLRTISLKASPQPSLAMHTNLV